jgi:hypothetical protein
MFDGYRVMMDDGVVDADDPITGQSTSFASADVLGHGSWIWAGILAEDGLQYDDIFDTGTFHRGADGAVYFVPDSFMVARLHSGSVAEPPAPANEGRQAGSGVDAMVAPYLAAAQQEAVVEPRRDTICFVRGTRIKTVRGEVPVEELTTGDRVLTLDSGYQAIRWIGSARRPARGVMAPVLIRAGTLGNERDLRVSQQHRMLLRGWQASLLFGESEVLVAAKALINDRTILREEGGEVEYFHLLFDRHEIIFAEGALAETFHPGEEAWNALDHATRNEILTLFPMLTDLTIGDYGPAARTTLRDFEARTLVVRMDL